MNDFELSQFFEGLVLEQLFGIAVASVLLCGMGFIAAYVYRERSAAALFCVWQMVGCAIVLTAVVLLSAPGIALRASRGMPHESPAIVPRTRVAESDLAEPFPDRLSTSPVFEDLLQESEAANADSSISANATHDRVAMSPLGVQVEMPRQGFVTDTNRIANWPTWLAAVWISVLLLQLGWFLSSVIICYAIARRAIPATDLALRALDRAASRIRFSALLPGLCTSSSIGVPFAIGVFRPVIVLPSESLLWSAAKLEVVLVHELAHIQRHDVPLHWIGRLGCCIAWFNPLVWLAARRAVFERERACDDRVVASGIDAEDYGQSLLEIAAAMSGRGIVLTGGVSMAEPPLMQRLRWILGKHSDRGRASTAFRVLTTVTFLVVAGLLGVIRPLATSSSATELNAPIPAPVQPTQVSDSQTSAAQTSVSERTQPSQAPAPNANQQANPAKRDRPIKLPASVQGSVTDLDGKPIGEATVEVKMVDFGDETQLRSQRVAKTVKRWTVKTDGQGRYTVDLNGLPEVPPRYSFGAEQVFADGFAAGRGRYWPTARDVANGQSIKAAKLTRGRKISGVVTTADGVPTAATMDGAGSSSDPNDTWWMRGWQVADDGTFELFVPVGADVELMVYAANHAPRRITTENGKDDLGRIVMPRGTRVTGVVRDLNGTGVAGVVVAMDTYDGQELERVAFGAHFASLTDDEGNFELPAARGLCRIHVTKSARQSGGAGQETLVGADPPPVVPSVISLAPIQPTTSVVLAESEVQVVRGAVRWVGGEPVADFEVVGGVMLEGRGIDLSYAVTDANGQYQLELPRGLSDAYLSAFGKKNAQGVWHMAYGVAKTPARPSGQFITLDRLENGFQGADWELRAFRTPEPVSESEQTANANFAMLQKMKQQVLADYIAADAKAEHAEKQQVYYELDPRNFMADKYLAFEREHRGDKVAFEAIREIMQGANSVGDPQTKVAKARNEMVDRLIEHYLGHEDLATVFHSLHGGPEVPRADALLRLASERSPHREVRAAAILARVEDAKEKLRTAQMIPEIEVLVQSRIAEAPASIRNAMTQRLAQLKAINVEELRTRANAWLDELSQDYAEVAHPHREVTYGQCAADMRFAINQVVIGQQAPQLVATDVNGKEVRLSDLQGKVVVLTFWQDIFDAAADLPNQNLAEQFDPSAVELVTILATPDRDKLTAALKDQDIAGSLVWEKLNGSLQARWGIGHYPTTFLISKDGQLTGGDLVSRDGMAQQVQKLLDE